MDGGAAARIARLALGEDTGLPVVEIGAGTGALTAALMAAGAAPRLIEIDADMIAILRGEAHFAALDIVHADALEIDYGTIAPGGDWIAVGNLPYNIGTPLVMRWVEADVPPRRIVVMLQRDVADRFVAQAGDDAYGSISVSAQIMMDVRRAFVLGPQVFYPRPKVESAVLIFERRARPLIAPELIAPTRALARAALHYRRKTLANSVELDGVCTRAEIFAALATTGLDPRVRGEAVSITQFSQLAECLLGRDPAAAG